MIQTFQTGCITRQVQDFFERVAQASACLCQPDRLYVAADQILVGKVNSRWGH